MTPPQDPGALLKTRERGGFDPPRPRRALKDLTLVSGAGEGEVVSKKVGKEVRGAQG